MGSIDVNVYGHFLEHINHSVVDGLYAEQVQGQGFEGTDFETFWQPFGPVGGAAVADVRFQTGTKSVRLQAGPEPAGTGNSGRAAAGRPRSDANPQTRPAGIRQGRIYLEAGRTYDGYVWLKPESGAPRVTFRVVGSDAKQVAETSLRTSGSNWQKATFSFRAARTDTTASIELAAHGSGEVLVDFLSLMRADVRANGMLRPDLVEALRALKPPFIRWPGGSYASIYLWRDAIGPQVKRTYHPNTIWGGYSDYYGFGTDEFMELARQLGTDPMVVLNATTTNPDSVQYAMDWVHYLLDPPTTEWGKLRAANGHPEPYRVPYIQIDNEPMNHGHTPAQYAEIVRAYGSQLRQIAPAVKIVACGQKRSNDMQWSQQVIDLAGDYFDILGVHNYEYENDLYATGVQRISDYLVKLRDYIRGSAHPDTKIAVLEWNLSRTYDWREGLHAAGSLIAYEQLGPELNMTAPALLLRNTTDDPTWSSLLYHDHVGWFPGGAYVVEKLFRDHYAEHWLASARGTFMDLQNRALFFDQVSTLKPEDWKPNSVEAIATASADGKRIVLKAVNYEGKPSVLLARLAGSKVPADAAVTVWTISAGPEEKASLAEPDRIRPVPTTLPFGRDLTVALPAYSVVVVALAAWPAGLRYLEAKRGSFQGSASSLYASNGICVIRGCTPGWIQSTISFSAASSNPMPPMVVPSGPVQTWRKVQEPRPFTAVGL
ncbi:MAG: alpha-N-arabinofuranosidase [Gemmatimonadetes bacterium]|nr:alpha-N-arabinofuranosidase [Gemmatimonadota bacterium]